MDKLLPLKPYKMVMPTYIRYERHITFLYYRNLFYKKKPYTGLLLLYVIVETAKTI